MRPWLPQADARPVGRKRGVIYHKYVVGIHLYESLAFSTRGKQEDGIMVKRGAAELVGNDGLVAHENKRAKGQDLHRRAAGSAGVEVSARAISSDRKSTFNGTKRR